jgi:hypothetical protein
MQWHAFGYASVVPTEVPLIVNYRLVNSLLGPLLHRGAHFEFCHWGARCKVFAH